ncbi:hypothetical protein [Nocardia farcinica]|uniref:hypothetical protein n=1 Tax=Nocardia farcinica TaxID=37329 RepID=UPI001E42D1D0|nr:hypothetical protein [Nocardia farcinica]MCZ9325755.1 hypothetical protein [Nocardia farcinica]
MLSVEPQQDREPQPRRTPLTAHQVELITDQCPGIDQLIRIQLTRHAAQAAPRPTRSQVIAAGDMILTGTPYTARTVVHLVDAHLHRVSTAYRVDVERLTVLVRQLTG